VNGETGAEKEIVEVVVIWTAGLCSVVVGNQRFRGRAASIFRVEVRDHGGVSNHITQIPQILFLRRENLELRKRKSSSVSSNNSHNRLEGLRKTRNGLRLILSSAARTLGSWVRNPLEA